MNFYNWLLQERQEINISKKIWNDLSFKAQIALEEWEISNWDKGKLTRHISNNDEIAKEIIITFKPIREYLKNKFGKTITLYRGMIKNDNSKVTNKILTSWTSDKKVAEHFAGLRTPGDWKSILKKPITDKQIKDAVDTYNKKGFVSFRGYKYIKNKEMPEYFEIYKGTEHITDGDNLERILKYDQEDIEHHNKKILEKAIVLKKEIDIDKILWITNRLNSKEFIVANKKLV